MNAKPGYTRSGPGRAGPGSNRYLAPAERATPARPTLDRLKRRKEFLRVAATRRRAATPGLVLQIANAPAGPPTDPSTGIRIGFTASRKVGGAVARNRARRRLREVVKQVMPVHAAVPRDYVVIARKGTLDRSFSELLGDLEKALKRLDAWQAAP